MKDFFKDNKVVLVLILILALFLRLWSLKHPLGIWSDEYIAYSISMFKFPFDFFDAIRTNSNAPLHYFYLKLWMSVFKNSDLMIQMSSLLPNLAGCLVMYFVGKNYPTKENSVKIGLVCALVSAISSFLIYFSIEARIYSLIFLLSSLVLLFSIKMYESPSKKNLSWLCIFSILLILEHTIGFVYVLFNMFGLMAFNIRTKKQKNEGDYFIPVLSGLVLCLPLIPFLLKLFSHPNWVSKWWSPFDWTKICFVFTDFFSPVLKNLTSAPVNFYHQIIKNDVINFGFVLFALVPAVIYTVLIIKSNIDAKRINKLLLCVFSAAFLTILITAIADKIPFLTKYLTELYPLLILMGAIGFVNINSYNTRVILGTVYVFMNLFYIIARHFLSIGLL